MLTFNVRKSTTIMSTRRWDLVVAGVELACGIAVAVYFVVLGLTAPDTPDRTAFDRAFPYLLAVLGLLLLGAMAWRSARRARDAHDHGGFSDDERQRGPHAGTPRVPPPEPAKAPERPERPVLSGEGRAEMERVVGVLADAGVLGPRVPDPAEIEEGVADAGKPVTAGSVLGALLERGYDDALEHLAFHDGQVEQFAGDLREQVDDLARLTGAPLGLETVEIAADGHHRLRLRLGDRTENLAYPGHVKYLSTVLHVTVARGQDVRLAWLWVDQGVWLTALDHTTVDQLNADLAAPEYERWEWVDEQEPTAAGAP